MKFIFDSDTWQEIYGGIRKNKTRTVITIIGVLWGIFLLVTLLGASRGLENNFKTIFGDFATNSVFVWTQRTELPFKGFQKGRRVRLTIDDVEILKRESDVIFDAEVDFEISFSWSLSNFDASEISRNPNFV